MLTRRGFVTAAAVAVLWRPRFPLADDVVIVQFSDTGQRQGTAKVPKVVKSAAEWRTSENNRRARYYAITKAGHRQLNENAASWRRVTGAVDAIMSAKLADAT